jgi:hypothetical protein
MSDTRTDPSPKKDRPEPGWLDELRERLSGWVDSILHPPVPVPVPVRRHR